MLNIEEIWLDGFKRGEDLVKDCPYEKDSEESRIWLSGWLEGAAKKSGSAYSKTLEEKLQGVEHQP